MNEEIYPMPFFPTLIVKDLEASSNFYQKVLGFKHIFTMPGLVPLRWEKYAYVLIAGHRDGEDITDPKGVGVTLNFNMLDHFNCDMDAFATHARQNGANVHGPIEQPWNVREVSVRDPDGYRLVFTMPLNVNLKFDEMLDRVKKAEESR